MQSMANELLVVGKITAGYGIKGWVKIHSYTDDPSDLFSFKHLTVERAGKLEQLEITNWREHGKGTVAHIKGVDDRNLAETYTRCLLKVSADQLPQLPAGEYYWNQLIGLTVLTTVNGEQVELGKVASMLETGANDVLSVTATATSIDDQERLIPYLVDQFVTKIDLEANCIEVDWDPDF